MLCLSYKLAARVAGALSGWAFARHTGDQSGARVLAAPETVWSRCWQRDRQQQQWDEVLMQSSAQQLMGGSMSNVFCADASEVGTPALKLPLAA